MTARLLASCLLALACAPPLADDPDAGAPPDAGPLDPVCEAVSPKQPRPAPITNGVSGPTVVSLSTGQQLAIGALLSADWRGRWSNFCTGMLVAPDVVLTAAHCLHDRRTVDAAHVRFGIGPDMASPVRTFAVSEVVVHPRWPRNQSSARFDFAILRLAERATDVVPELVPIAVNRTPIDASLAGRRAQVVGYGATAPEDDANTRRYWTTEEVVSVTSFDVAVDGQGRSAVCFGDSGGPLLLTDAAGVVRTYGVLSWGDDTCLDVDHFGRIDVQLDWLEDPSVAGPLPEPDPDPLDPCNGVPVTGSCVDSIAHWCEDGEVRSLDCAPLGRRCGERDDGLVTCLPDECGGVTWEGVCTGDVARWCDGGVLRTFDCGACHRTCGEAGALGNFCRPR